MDFAITIENQTGLGQMTFEKAKTIMNNIYLSMMVKRGSFFYDPTFGKRRREREKNTPRTMRLNIDDCKESLQWMIDTGKAKTIEVYAQRDLPQDLHRLKMLIEVTPVNSDQPIAFSTFIGVV